jgi:hypothetical protein
MPRFLESIVVLPLWRRMSSCLENTLAYFKVKAMPATCANLKVKGSSLNNPERHLSACDGQVKGNECECSLFL